MTAVLGIHCGHEASCAVVRDGRLVAAIQQERVTRRKYDGQEFLSDRLPIGEVLAVAGIDVTEVDLIVSSFQAVGPSAVGLQRPLFAPEFAAFDPFDRRHQVISHHLAHAASAAYPSGLARAAVLVSDSAGSTSRDGADYYLPFEEFFASYRADRPAGPLFTEMRSSYAFRDGGFELLRREYSQPHNQPDVFVQSEASLYDNVARYLFRTEHAHGQLMALAGIPTDGPAKVVAGDIVTSDRPPRLKNGWQLFDAGADPLACADIAAATQDAFTQLIGHFAARAVRLAGIPDLCCAGGVFLNLTGNSAIAEMPGVREIYVPSCPHDAGISVGAAYYGWAQLAAQSGAVTSPPSRLGADFLGRTAEPIDAAVAASYGYTPTVEPQDDLAAAAVDVLADGAIIARFAGPAEFGPRALGNRSLLCHPVTCRDARNRLNRLKQRQPWRPVAPMVREPDLHVYFDGPDRAEFMNFNFTVRPEYLQSLAEATHADGTARVQTVTAEANPDIWRLLTLLAERGLPPVLINTSFNGPGQPIIDSAVDALDYVRHPEVDYLLTADQLFTTPAPGTIAVRRADTAVLAMFGTGVTARYLLSGQDGSVPINRQLFQDLCADEVAVTDRGQQAVLEGIRSGLLLET